MHSSLLFIYDTQMLQCKADLPTSVQQLSNSCSGNNRQFSSDVFYRHHPKASWYAARVRRGKLCMYVLMCARVYVGVYVQAMPGLSHTTFKDRIGEFPVHVPVSLKLWAGSSWATASIFGHRTTFTNLFSCVPVNTLSTYIPNIN